MRRMLEEEEEALSSKAPPISTGNAAKIQFCSGGRERGTGGGGERPSTAGGCGTALMAHAEGEIGRDRGRSSWRRDGPDECGVWRCWI